MQSKQCCPVGASEDMVLLRHDAMRFCSIRCTSVCLQGPSAASSPVGRGAAATALQGRGPCIAAMCGSTGLDCRASMQSPHASRTSACSCSGFSSTGRSHTWDSGGWLSGGASTSGWVAGRAAVQATGLDEVRAVGCATDKAVGWQWWFRSCLKAWKTSLRHEVLPMCGGGSATGGGARRGDGTISSTASSRGTCGTIS